MIDPPAPQEPARGFSRFLWPLAVVLTLAIWGVYANSLNVPFNYDDEVVIQENEGIQDLQAFKQIYPIHYRHFFYLSFAVNYAFGEMNPFGYHVFNVTTHCLVALALWGVLWTTLRKSSGCENKYAFGIATATAFLFALNPIHTEAVTYISGRSSSLSGLFFLLSLWVFILGNSKPEMPLFKRIGLYLLTYGLAGLAIFTKETLLMLVVILPLYDLCFMRTGSWAPFKQRLYFFYLPLPVLGALAVALSPNLVAVGMEWLAKAQPGYALQQLSVIPYAAKLVLFPINLVFDYDFAQADFSTSTGRMLGGGLIVLVVCAAWVSLYRVYPLAAFCAGWFLLLLIPTNSFLPRMDLLSERNLYLPSIGLLLLMVTLVFRTLTSLHRPDLTKVALGGLVLLLILNAALVVNRNQAYRSNIALWEDTYNKSPGKARVYHNLSHFYIEAGNFEKAFVMLKKLAGAKTTPYYLSYAHTHLGNIYVRFGRMNLAEQEFNKALRLDPDIPTGYYNLGVLYATREQHDEALKFLKRAEEAQSKFHKGQLLPPTLDLYMGKSHFHLAQYDLARQRVERFLVSDPESPLGHLLLGHIFQNNGQPEKATQAYRRVKGSTGIQAQAHQALAELMLEQKRQERAIEEYEKAVSLNPKVLETRYQLGRLLLVTKKNKAKAKQHLEYALNLSPPPHRLVEIENLLEQLD